MLPVQARATQHDEEPSSSVMRTFSCLNPNLPSPCRGPSPSSTPPASEAGGPPSDPSAPRYQPPCYSSACGTSSEHTEYSCHDYRSRIACGSRPRRARGIHLSYSAWNTGRSPSSPARASSHGLFTLRLFTCPTRCSIHHRQADRCTASTLRHFLQPH